MPKWALYKMGMMESAVMRLPMVLPELSSQKRIEELLKKYALISG
jgi:4-hydroxy-tetrahydrodipicolinate synthase